MADIKPLKKPLKEPIWEKQEVKSKNNKTEYELPKQRFFFNLFCKHGGTLSQFTGAIEGLCKGDVFLEVKLKYNPYSKYTFEDLCTVHEWLNRRSKKEEYEVDLLYKKLDDIDRENLIEEYTQKKRVKRKILDLLEGKLEDGVINGTQTKDYVTAINGMQDSQKKDKGEDTQKVEVDANLKAGVETNLHVEDNHALATVQAMFMQPEFIEMNKKLMDKTADELQKHRNSDE